MSLDLDTLAQQVVEDEVSNAALQEKLNIALEHDPDVQKVSGQQAKLAAAQNKHAREQRIVNYCEQLHIGARSYHDVIKLTFDTLKDTKDDLMRQLAVVKQQIAIGEVNSSRFPVAGDNGSFRQNVASASVELEIAEALDTGSGNVAI